MPELTMTLLNADNVDAVYEIEKSSFAIPWSHEAFVREATEKLKGKDGLIGRLLSDKELSDNAAKVVENLAAVSGRLEKGEGTLGKLTAERALYDEISALVKDVRQIVDNYRDTTPITTFGSLATGAL